MKANLIAGLVAVVLIGGAFAFIQAGKSAGGEGQGSDAYANNVSVVDGKQIVEIWARGGYQPRASVAKAGIPTVIRFNTKGTFDCSSSVRIPSMGISRILPQSGSTDIDLGIQGTSTLQGSCGMGMYPFQVEFK
ncbi:MAG: hypothetical protein WC763_01060 [Candidatus Paceibacterota bacterium]|jgi:plastocyanin domain-containing protein